MTSIGSNTKNESTAIRLKCTSIANYLETMLLPSIIKIADEKDFVTIIIETGLPVHRFTQDKSIISFEYLLTQKLNFSFHSTPDTIPYKRYNHY
jgi:hypothetical protein